MKYFNSTNIYDHVTVALGNTNPANSASDQETYEDYFHPEFPRFFTVILFFIGIFGNLLSILVFSQKPLRKNSTFIYLLYLCIIDLFVILFGLADLILISYLKFIIRHTSLHVCRWHTFFTYTFTHLSSFILASVSIDRAIATNLLNFAKEYCKPRTAHRVLALNLLLAILINFHFLIFLGYIEDPVIGTTTNSSLNKSGKSNVSNMSIELNHIKNNSENQANNFVIDDFYCAAKRGTDYELFVNKYYVWMDLIFYAILPFITMAICSFFIIRVIFVSHQRIKRNLSQRNSSAIIKSTRIKKQLTQLTIENNSIENNNNNNSSSKMNGNGENEPILDENEINSTTFTDKTQIKDTNFWTRMSTIYSKRRALTDKKPTNTRLNKTLHLTYTLISINVLFFSLVSPLVFVMILYNEKEAITKNKMLYNIVYLLAYSNHSFNFIFYGLSSPPYRQAVKSLFFKKKKDHFSNLTNVTIVNKKNTN